MLDRRTLLKALIFAACVSMPAAAQPSMCCGGGGGGGGGQRRRRRRWRGQRDVIMAAIRDGRARPLSEHMKRLRGDLGGDLIDIDIEIEDRGTGPLIYVLKVMQPGGHLSEVKVDALSGAIIERSE